MTHEDIKKYAVTFARSRSNLLLVVAFTTINLFLHLTGSDFFLLFSATLPSLALGFLDSWGPAGSGVIVAFAAVFLYCLFWALAKRNRVFILFALVFFTIDTIVFFYLLFVVIAQFEGMFLVEVAFHLWIMFYLVTGAIAWYKLRDVDAEAVAAAHKDATANAASKEADEAIKGLLNEDKKDEDKDNQN